MKQLRLVVDPRESGTTLEALLIGRGGMAAETFASALRSGAVTVNRQRVRSPDRLLASRDLVVAHLEAHGVPAQPGRLDPSRLLLIDAHLVAIDKPAGVPAQATPENARAGIDAAVSALLHSRGEPGFAGIVHRLDRDTSGVMVLARTPDAVRALSEAFRSGAVRKRYLALAAGNPAEDAFEVDRPLGRDRRHPAHRAADPHGEKARTSFRVLARHAGHGVAACRMDAAPATGRTHQIRVHAALAGHPLLGDRLYGGPVWVADDAGRRLELPRVALHAASLALDHPAGGRLELAAPWPPDLARLESELTALAGS